MKVLKITSLVLCLLFSNFVFSASLKNSRRYISRALRAEKKPSNIANSVQRALGLTSGYSKTPVFAHETGQKPLNLRQLNYLFSENKDVLGSLRGFAHFNVENIDKTHKDEPSSMMKIFFRTQFTSSLENEKRTLYAIEGFSKIPSSSHFESTTNALGKMTGLDPHGTHESALLFLKGEFTLKDVLSIRPSASKMDSTVSQLNENGLNLPTDLLQVIQDHAYRARSESFVRTFASNIIKDFVKKTGRLPSADHLSYFLDPETSFLAEEWDSLLTDI